MTPHPAVQDTVLVKANPQQYHQSLVNQHPSWGTGFTLDQFIDREHKLLETGMGKQMQCWVLVPKDDTSTSDILCSCETYKRSILWIERAATPVIDAVGYSVASVFTPPNNRGKGYAQHMMTTLHSKFKSSHHHHHHHHQNDDHHKPEQDDDDDAVVSFLYSDVGDFYSRAGPPGWHIQGIKTTVWQVDTYPSNDTTLPNDNHSIQPITQADFSRIANKDAQLMKQELSKSNSFPSFATLPWQGSYDWQITKAITYARSNDLNPPTEWGFQLVDNQNESEELNFIIYNFELKRKTMKILRIRSTSSKKFEILLDQIVSIALEFGVERIIAWNVDDELLKGINDISKRGNTADRKDSLSALAEYVGEGEINWKFNEAYAWC
ncbi:hypothetical protein OIO90_002812 [Microbotryomycetes sp. JL221]|nr:hypothetical protein OIO90_002812 [Microbotryomycetes sp. JL221]